MLNQIEEEAKTKRLQLLDVAREESNELPPKLQAALKNEKRRLNEALTHCAREEVFAIARKVLTDLAGTTLEERMTDIFLDRLRELNDTEMTGLKSAFKTSTSPLLVRTAFTLPKKQCAAIESLIKEILGKEKQVQFTIAPDLVSGIEISANGEKIAWSIADYLASLAKSVDSLLKTQSDTESIVKPNTGQGHDEN